MWLACFFVFEKDKLYGMTLIGPHRDDYSLFLGDSDLSIYGSQGQNRVAILSLKLSEIFMFKEKTGDYPILLLDDVLAENDLSIDEGQKEKFLREVEKQLPDIIEVIPTSEDLLGSSYGSNIERIQIIFSDNTKILLCASLVISGVIVIILKRKEFEWCANLGVALLIAGLVTIGISFVMPGMVIDMMGTTDLSMFASSLTEALAEPILYSGVGVLVLAALLFIFYKIIEKRRDNKIKS